MTVQTWRAGRDPIALPARTVTRHGTGDPLQEADPPPGRFVRRGSSGDTGDLIRRNGMAPASRVST